MSAPGISPRLFMGGTKKRTEAYFSQTKMTAPCEKKGLFYFSQTVFPKSPSAKKTGLYPSSAAKRMAVSIRSM